MATMVSGGGTLATMETLAGFVPIMFVATRNKKQDDAVGLRE